MKGFSKLTFDSNSDDDGEASGGIAGVPVKCAQCGKLSCFCLREQQTAAAAASKATASALGKASASGSGKASAAASGKAATHPAPAAAAAADAVAAGVSSAPGRRGTDAATKAPTVPAGTATAVSAVAAAAPAPAASPASAASAASARWAPLADRLNPQRPAFDAALKAQWPSLGKAKRKKMLQQDRKQIAALQSRGSAALPFEADPDDHCETSPTAYQHVAPLLHMLARRLGKSAAELQVGLPPTHCSPGPLVPLSSTAQQSWG